MGKISLLAALLFLFVACSPSKKTSSDSKTSTTATTTSTTPATENDGSNFEKAIVINKNSESAGIAEEYKWLREHYPGYTSQGQSLSHKGGKSYDVLHITTKDGEKKDVYFDITKFFGKF